MLEYGEPTFFRHAYIIAKKATELSLTSLVQSVPFAIKLGYSVVSHLLILTRFVGSSCTMIGENRQLVTDESVEFKR